MANENGLRYRLYGKDASLSELGEIVARTEKPRGLFDAIGEELVASTEKRFVEGKDPDDNPWPASIRALSEGGQTLVDTGKLAGSMKWTATDKFLEVGTNAIYAAIHQFGGIIKPVTAKALRFMVGGEWATVKQVEIPARPFLGINENDRAEIILIGENWLREAAGE